VGKLTLRICANSTQATGEATHDKISKRAYELWQQGSGDEQANWYSALSEFRAVTDYFGWINDDPQVRLHLPAFRQRLTFYRSSAFTT
jgi:hypothetical protein